MNPSDNSDPANQAGTPLGQPVTPVSDTPPTVPPTAVPTEPQQPSTSDGGMGGGETVPAEAPKPAADEGDKTPEGMPGA